jgi:hypothetical protein
MTDPNDDLADVLGPQPAVPVSGLRETLLRRTERRLARDRWVRRGAKVAAVAAVFLAGGAAGWLVRAPVADALGSPVPEVVVVPVPVPVPVPAPVADAPGSPSSPPLSGSEAELRAEQADGPTEAARLYRVAGDSFLRTEDYANATRCYRLFLIRAGDPGLAIEANDSWLLVSLKNAAFKEKTDALKTDG